jgi:FHA domain-containing protein
MSDRSQFGLQRDSRRADPLADFMARPLAPLRGAVAANAGAAATDADDADSGPAGMFADIPVDPLEALFRDSPPEPDAIHRHPSTPPDHVPLLQAGYRPPRVGHATPRERPSAPTRTVPITQARSLWQAFCAGAGIRIADLPPDREAERMSAAGRLVRAAVDGTLRLITLRATQRQEWHAQVTRICPQGNNPLKFSPDTQSALEQLLQSPQRGFLDAPDAMTDAMHDLIGHAIGTMAGTRAALDGVLERFAPPELEEKLEARPLDGMLPRNRQARLWQLYLRHYASIRGEARDDFHALFGRAFLGAYQQQLERLAREWPKR